MSLLTVGVHTSVQAAEQISFYYHPFGEFKVQVEDLEILATEGRITKKLAFFTNRLTPQQLDQLKNFISAKNLSLMRSHFLSSLILPLAKLS